MKNVAYACFSNYGYSTNITSSNSFQYNKTILKLMYVYSKLVIVFITSAVVLDDLHYCNESAKTLCFF